MKLLTATDLTPADDLTWLDGSRYAVISSPAHPESEPLVMEMVILAAAGRAARLRAPT